MFRAVFFSVGLHASNLLETLQENIGALDVSISGDLDVLLY